MTEKLTYFPVIQKAFSDSRLPYILRDTLCHYSLITDSDIQISFSYG